MTENQILDMAGQISRAIEGELPEKRVETIASYLRVATIQARTFTESRGHCLVVIDDDTEVIDRYESDLKDLLRAMKCPGAVTFSRESALIAGEPTIMLHAEIDHQHAENLRWFLLGFSSGRSD